jgi:N-acetylated-alpha-linked acidic dipeptidase
MVVIGTHYDTWAYGVRDNTAGVTTQLEMARGLGVLLDAGWRPKRTLLVAFFGSEDRGVIGSTEFTEQMGAGMDRVVAFINPAHLAGSMFRASAVPALDEFLLETARRVEWGGTGTTIYDHWSANSESGEPLVGRLGGGTDHMSFLFPNGTPVISVGARSIGSRYHSICDDLHSMLEFTDPGLRYHASMSQISGLLAIRLAGADLLPFRYSSYAEEVAENLRDFEEVQRTKLGRIVVDVGRDIEQAGAWADAARRFETTVSGRLASGEGAASFVPLNRALMSVERALLNHRGIPGRPWYLHQIYAPQYHNGFAVEILPGLHDALFVQEVLGDAAPYESDLFESLLEATQIFEEIVR